MGKVDGLNLEGLPKVASVLAPPLPPPPPPLTAARFRKNRTSQAASSPSPCGQAPATKMWECLFDEAYRADVSISTDHGGVVYAHSSVLGVASPVMKTMLKQSRRKGRKQVLAIHGVPPDAVRVFIRFLYSSCYEQHEMEEYVLNLLVLSHAYVIPHLKRLCEQQLEQGLLNTENVMDIFQLALLCDAPRLSLICHRIILRNFKAVSETDGWKVMKQSHPLLEKELLVSMIYADNIRKERRRKLQDRKIYLQLYDAMEALVHIFRDGCRTIGPADKVLKEDGAPCRFEACKGLELLVRHLAACKLRVPGSCVHCKRMWQLLELHSRICADSSSCRVPLCRNFKERISKQNKKDEIRWRLLVRNVLRANSISWAAFYSLENIAAV